MADDDKRTDSGIQIEPLYTQESLAGWNAAEKLGTPGTAPYTRGVYPTMYRGKLWTMRQYAGFGSAESTNLRFKFLLGRDHCRIPFESEDQKHTRDRFVRLRAET